MEIYVHNCDTPVRAIVLETGVTVTLRKGDSLPYPSDHTLVLTAVKANFMWQLVALPFKLIWGIANAIFR
jgi:hypothetical protein